MFGHVGRAIRRRRSFLRGPLNEKLGVVSGCLDAQLHELVNDRAERRVPSLRKCSRLRNQVGYPLRDATYGSRNTAAEDLPDLGSG